MLTFKNNVLRNELLHKLLNLNTSVSVITDELNNFSWDSNEQLVNLTRQHILNVLLNYQAEKINEDEIEEWANAIEGREDIGREIPYKNMIDQILYELANPCLIEEPLTKERAKILCIKLRSVDISYR